MTPEEIKAARVRLGRTQQQMARLVGMETAGDPAGLRKRFHRVEAGAEGRTLSAPQVRLMRAYLDGYRPSDWDA